MNRFELENEDPTLADLIEETIRRVKLETHVWIPVKVETVTVEEDIIKVDVLPLLKKVYQTDSESSEEVVTPPVIPNVPVGFYASDGGNTFVALPIKKGDTGILLCCDKSINSWLAGDGGVVAPKLVRSHNLADGIFLPVLRTFNTPLAGISLDDIIIKNNDLKVTIANGKISIENVSTELLAILDSFLGELILPTFVVGPPIGPSATHTHLLTWPSVGVALTAQKALLGTLKI